MLCSTHLEALESGVEDTSWRVEGLRQLEP
jgi:hypothetical protein